MGIKTLPQLPYSLNLTALISKTPTLTETLLHSLERTAGGIGFHVNRDKTEYMCFNQRGDISTLKSGRLKLVNKFNYIGSSVSSTEKDINRRLAKVWIAIDRLSVIRKSDLTDKIKRSFYLSSGRIDTAIWITSWTQNRHMEKKLDGNYTRMQRTILIKSWRQHRTKLQLYGHLPPITKTIKLRRHEGHCWRIKEELISDILRWTPSQGGAKTGWLARTYMEQLCADAGYSLKNLPVPMDDRDELREDPWWQPDMMMIIYPA